jgi:hypothetical protein
MNLYISENISDSVSRGADHGLHGLGLCRHPHLDDVRHERLQPVDARASNGIQ